MGKQAKIMAMLGLLVLCGSVWAQDSGLIAYWKFDEGSGTTAYDSAGDNNGTIYGAVWTTGQVNGALSFDGDGDYVDCGSTFASVTGSTTKSIMAWVRSDSQTAGGRILTLYRWSDKSTGFSILRSGAPATWLSLYMKGVHAYEFLDSGVPVTANTWTHIALVQDAANVDIYINGVSENSASNAAAPAISNPINADIGAYAAGWSFFSGTIDDVRIYDRALSPEEIQQISQVGLGDVVGLEIIGPEQVRENCQTQYKALVYYDDGHARDVTDLALWEVEPDSVASIEAGLLRTEEIYQLQDITIYAAYTAGGATVQEQMTVQVLVTPYIWYVPADYETIQAAIDAAIYGDVVLVADGTYTGPGNRDIDFLGKPITVRSESGPENCIIDCNGTEADPHRGFYFNNNENNNAVVEGFTITNGYAHSGGGIYCGYDSSPTINNCTISDNRGSGIYCEWESSPTISNCTITNNTTTGWGGGGVYCEERSSLRIDKCTITGNKAFRYGGAVYSGGRAIITNSRISGNSAKSTEGWGGYGYGGGIYCEERSNLRIDKCTITGNKAFSYGGAVCVGTEKEGGSGRAIITNSRISGNSAGSGGGGIYFRGQSLKIINCIFSGNSAEVDGGGISGCEGWGIGYLTITNSTFSNNSAGRYGGGIFYEYQVHPEQITLRNSILWGNTDDSGTGQLAQVRTYEGQMNADVKFTCIQDDNPSDANIPFGADPNFNIDDDPCFVLLGYWDQNSTPAEPNDDFWVEGNYHLRRNSPCIEAGISDVIPPARSVAVDIDGQPRIIGLNVDMGADEFELPIIIVTKPQQGDIWANSSTHEIKWDSYAISGTVDISYSTNNGADWLTIEGDTTNTGSFTWYLPSAVDSNQCLVLVEPNTPDSNVICIESGLFAIQPDFIHPDVPSKWKSLGGNFRRTGLSQDYGPEAGCIKWQFQTDARVPATTTIGAGDRIHVACEDGKVYTLDPDGSLLWTYDTNSTLLSAPSIGPSGSVYVGSEDGKLYAISIAGRLRWTHSTDGSIYSSPAVSENGTVYVCSTAGVLYALAPDGSELWSFETDSFGSVVNAIFASPAIAADGTIYIGGLYDPNLYALDPNNGSVKWACSFVDPCRPRNSYGWPFTSPVVAADGTIYQTLLYDSNLYAIEPNAGTIIWSTVLAEQCPIWLEPPCSEMYGDEDSWLEPVLGPNGIIYYVYGYVDSWFEPVLGPDSTIYVTLDGDPYLRAVDPDGTIKWAIRLEGITGGFTLTIGSNGLIYAASDDGYLYILYPDGGRVARFESDNWLSFPVIASDDTMIISDSNNTILAIGFNGCEGKTPALIRSEDLNADGAINFSDFAVMAADWLECTDGRYSPSPYGDEGPFCDDWEKYFLLDEEFFLAGDINRDFYVDLADLAALAYRWLYTEAYESNYIQAAMKLTPQMLNCNSKGNWVKAHFVLPEEFLPEDVDVYAPAVAEPMGIESEYIKVLGSHKGQVRLEICFDRETFCAHAQITETGEVEVTVTGSLTTSRYFYATDTIRIKP